MKPCNHREPFPLGHWDICPATYGWQRLLSSIMIDKGENDYGPNPRATAQQPTPEGLVEQEKLELEMSLATTVSYCLSLQVRAPRAREPKGAWCWAARDSRWARTTPSGPVWALSPHRPADPLPGEPEGSCWPRKRGRAQPRRPEQAATTLAWVPLATALCSPEVNGSVFT